MKCVISRSYGPSETKGYFAIFDGSVLDYHCFTLELPNNGNLPFVSCIPEGVYYMVKYNHPEKGWIFLIQGVRGREGVELHAGNFATGKKIDTEGCILPGLAFQDIDGNGTLDIIESKIALGKIMGYLPDTTKLYVI
jgi:hypothetical protein